MVTFHNFKEIYSVYSCLIFFSQDKPHTCLVLNVFFVVSKLEKMKSEISAAKFEIRSLNISVSSWHWKQKNEKTKLKTSSHITVNIEKYINTCPIDKSREQKQKRLFYINVKTKNEYYIFRTRKYIIIITQMRYVFIKITK